MRVIGYICLFDVAVCRLSSWSLGWDFCRSSMQQL